jgi:hypothetical protein
MHLQDYVDRVCAGAKRTASWFGRYTFGNGSDSLYDIRSSVLLGYVLSVVLWWIPLLGPMTVGYVAGRKAGTPLRGLVFAALGSGLAVASVYAVSYAVFGYGGYGFPGMDLAAISQALAAQDAWLSNLASWLSVFYTPGTSDVALGLVGTSAAFGFVGGVMSGQARKEAAVLMATGAVGEALRSKARSLSLYDRDKTLGFKSFDDCIASQRMTVNANNTDEGPVAKGPRPSTGGRPVGNTVQTVTTTVTSDTEAGTKTESPFADILSRSERRRQDAGGDRK